MEEKLKKPLHVKEGKVIRTPSEKNVTSSASGTGTVQTSSDKSMKEKMGEKKENMSNKIHEVKEGASEKKEEIQEGISDIKEEANKTKEEYEKESEKEGMTPAEKILNDIVTRFRQGTGQINDAISDYNAKTEDSKESKENKAKKALKPLVDVLETNDTVYLIADISGVKKDNISIGISKNSVELTVKYKEDPDNCCQYPEEDQGRKSTDPAGGVSRSADPDKDGRDKQGYGAKANHGDPESTAGVPAGQGKQGEPGKDDKGAHGCLSPGGIPAFHDGRCTCPCGSITCCTHRHR